MNNAQNANSLLTDIVDHTIASDDDFPYVLIVHFGDNPAGPSEASQSVDSIEYLNDYCISIHLGIASDNRYGCCPDQRWLAQSRSCASFYKPAFDLLMRNDPAFVCSLFSFGDLHADIKLIHRIVVRG